MAIKVKFEIYPGKGRAKGKHYWRCRHINGNITSVGGQGYGSANCRRAVLLHLRSLGLNPKDFEINRVKQ